MKKPRKPSKKAKSQTSGGGGATGELAGAAGVGRRDGREQQEELLGLVRLFLSLASPSPSSHSLILFLSRRTWERLWKGPKSFVLCRVFFLR